MDSISLISLALALGVGVGSIRVRVRVRVETCSKINKAIFIIFNVFIICVVREVFVPCYC
jgi:hypothetical protein